MVSQYRKKPVVISAMVWTGDNHAEMLDFCKDGYITGNQLTINTLEGLMLASHGDYVIQGVKGEFYACKPDVFEMTYESVTK